MSINTNNTASTSTSTTMILTPSTTTTNSTSNNNTFIFPKTYSFPPFFTLQPTALTLQAQLAKWSSLIQSYCQHHKIYQLPITSSSTVSSTTSSLLPPPSSTSPSSTVVLSTETLFSNAQLKKRLAEKDVKTVIDYMASNEGDHRAEWTNSTSKTSAWIWWRKPEEWGDMIARWVDETGQKGSVLTLFEIVEGDGTEGQEFHGMNMEVLHKSLNVLVKKGKAQIFGAEDSQGVKFF